MARKGKKYYLTYDDKKLPKHYGWKTDARIDQLKQQFERVVKGSKVTPERSVSELEREVKQIVKNLDQQGRWVSTYQGERLVGQAKMPVGTKYLASALFSQNLDIISSYLAK